ncbi:MAG: DUF6335 family protein [Chloroflexota bacterium]
MSEQNRDKDLFAQPEPERTVKENLSQRQNRKPTEVISLDIAEEGEAPLDLDVETTIDLLQDAQEEAYAARIAEYTDDEEIQESLEERQELNTGREQLIERLQEHTSKSPELSGGDVDAAWDYANVGQETVGGTAPTPDQDVVDELGAAMGIEYEDDEPLHTADKLEERDRNRWELNPESAEEEES